MDIRKIKKLIELLEESDVEELEIHEGDDSVRISRRREQLAAPQYMAQYPSPAPQPASPQPSAPAADEPAKPAEPSGHTGEVADGWHLLPLALTHRESVC